MKKTDKNLTDWYCGQPFEIVKKITGIDPMDAEETDDLPSEWTSDTSDICRDDLICEAREVWNKLSLEEKIAEYETYKDYGYGK
jgi:hypothetical protein